MERLCTLEGPTGSHSVSNSLYNFHFFFFINILTFLGPLTWPVFNCLSESDSSLFFTWCPPDFKFGKLCFISEFTNQFSNLHLCDCQDSGDLDMASLYLLPPDLYSILYTTFWFTVCFSVPSDGHSQEHFRSMFPLWPYANYSNIFMRISAHCVPIHEGSLSASSWDALEFLQGHIQFWIDRDMKLRPHDKPSKVNKQLLTQACIREEWHLSRIKKIKIFYLFIFYWRIIVLQNFVVYCQTSTWISHRYTYIPSILNLTPISHPISPSVDTEPLFEFPEPLQQFPIVYLFHIWQCNLPCNSFHTSHPLLPSIHVHKSTLYVCFSIAALKMNPSVLFF